MGLKLQFTYDWTTGANGDTTAPPSSFITALQTAAADLAAVVTNNITLNIEVGWGETGGSADPSGSASGGPSQQSLLSYSQVRSELLTNVTGAAATNLSTLLPTTDPFASSDGGSYAVSMAQEKAWGLVSPNASGIDGVIGVSTTGWSSSDYVAVLLHEITHAMGRLSGYNNPSSGSYVTPLDLFRYSSPGVRVSDGSLVDPSVNPGVTGHQYFSVDGGQTNLANFASSSDYGDFHADTLTTVDPFDAYQQPNSNALTSVDITELGAMGYATTINCFYPGTRIATPDGETQVEDLRAGDLVLTAEGEKPVRWIGQSHVSRHFADPLRTLPVRIAEGALGGGLPRRALLVSPDHALYLDGVLVQAGALAGWPGITRAEDAPEHFTYYHVELAGHELLYAEGALTESFVDNVDRRSFHNWDERITPTQPIAEMPYPRVKSARQLPVCLRRALAA